MVEFTRYEDVKGQTTEEYFLGNQFSIDAFKKKYVNDENETYVKAIKRICDYVASVEKTNELRKYWAERWFNEIYNDWWHPAGSICQGAGSNSKVSLANCTTVDLGVIANHEEWDNLESIIKNSAYTVAKSAAYRQGLGVDFSRLRPVGARVENSSNESSGAVHWMKFIDSIGYYVGQKGRIPAMLFSLSCSHPDIEEFITVKRDYTKIQNANISVQCTDKFYEAVENDADWELSFEIPEVKKGEKIYLDVHSTDKDTLKDEKGYYKIATRDRKSERISKIVKARALLELIAKNMAENAEPGIQNIDLAKKYSNSDYVYDSNDVYNSRILSTNAPVVGSTLIPTPSGIFPIEELFNREQSLVLADTISTLPPHLIDWKESNRGKTLFPTETIVIPATFRKFENQEVYKLTLANQKELYCNAEHQWLINGKMTKTIDIKSGDKLFRPQSGIIQSLNLSINRDSETFKNGELIGYFVGDGWIGKPSNIHQKMIGIIYDEECRYFSDLFRDKFKETTGKELVLERNRGKIYEVRAESKEFVKFFEQFGFSDNKYRIPQRCYTDLDFCAGFLRGLFQADGYVFLGSRSGSITLTSVSQELICGVESLLANWFGIFPSIRKSKSKRIKYKTKNGNTLLSNAKDRFDLKISRYQHIKMFNDLIGLIGTKGEKLQKIANHYKGRQVRNSVKVIKVEKLEEKQDMYCAVVDKLHSFVVDGVISSNCSEQYLSRESLCVLASLNCAKFSIDPKEYEEELSVIGESINRFLDNVNECELRYHTYATPHQKLAIEKLRRTGAGYTNLGGWLFKKNLEYGSEEGNKAVEHFTERYNFHLYRSSIALGKEKGNFGLFNKEKFEQSPFVQRMMGLGLVFDTMRNVTCSSIAPTGTLSLMFRCSVMSYGVEPAFGMYYWKRTRMSGKYEYYFCVPSIVREVFREKGYEIPIDSDTIKDTWDGKYGRPIAKFIEEHKDKIGIRFKNATEVSVFDKLDLMSRVMKWIDSSISVTYMLPESSNWKDVYDFILLARKKEVKSIAAFPDKKMYGIVSFEPFKQLAERLISDGVKIHEQNFSEEETKELGKLNLVTNSKIIKTSAPKRPKELACDIHHFTIKGVRYFVVIGLLGNDPYEVFVERNHDSEGEIIVPRNKTEGIIVKEKRGHYKVVDKEKNEIVRVVSSNTEEHEEALARMVSAAMRHGADVNFVVQQLEKTRGDFQGFAKVLARALKKYIQEGVKVTGDKCPNCNSESLFRQEGCISCQCGWSKCS